MKQAGSNYVSNMNTKSQEMKQLLTKAADDNRTVYYEKEPPSGSLAPPDPKPFVKLTDVKQEMTHTSDLEAKLRHLVPPQVRQDL